MYLPTNDVKKKRCSTLIFWRSSIVVRIQWRKIVLDSSAGTFTKTIVPKIVYRNVYHPDYKRL